MARIRSYEPGNRKVAAHKTFTDCTYQIVEAESGETLLALSTYGSDHRQDKDTVSQSMQFDEATASLLLRSLYDAFPSLVVRHRG